jgi:hypothetical protein
MRVGFGNVLTTTEHLDQAWTRIVAESERLMRR